MVGGHQRRSRKCMIAIPIENADDQTADQFSKVLMWCCDQEGILETISESFHGALVTGMNLLQVWVDYRSDPVSGNIGIYISAPTSSTLLFDTADYDIFIFSGSFADKIMEGKITLDKRVTG